MTAASPLPTGLPAMGLTAPTVGRLDNDSAAMRGSCVARLNHDAVAVRWGSSMTRLDHDPVPMSRRGVTSLHRGAVTRLDHDSVPMPWRGVTRLHDDTRPTMATRGATVAATVTPLLAAMLPDRGGPGGPEGRAGVVRFHEPWRKGHEEGG